MHSVCSVACVAGVRKGRGRELVGETAREGGGRNLSFLPRAPKFPLPLPLVTPATQAMCSANNGLCQC